MSEGDYTDENIMKRWEKELKREKEERGGERMGLDDLKGQIRELEFKIGRLFLIKKNIIKELNKEEVKKAELVGKLTDKTLGLITASFRGGIEELEKEKEEKLLVLCKKEIEELEEGKRGKEEELKKREVEIAYLSKKLNFLEDTEKLRSA